LAKNRVHVKGLGIKQSVSVSWAKDPDTGHYWRTTQELTHNVDEYTIKKNGKPVKSDNPYIISTIDDYDYSMNYTGIDNEEATVYFKELVPEIIVVD
jgi:hypothetical protein